MIYHDLPGFRVYHDLPRDLPDKSCGPPLGKNNNKSNFKSRSEAGNTKKLGYVWLGTV